jgi:hypothetical protein
MRGSIVVLALVVSPFVASVSQAQHDNRPHWRRHDLPASARVDRDDDRKSDDKKCEEKTRGNPSQSGIDHRADPTTKGNKDCSTATQTPPPPAPPPVVLGHTGVQGSLFFDLDHDGLFGPDEVALAGWTVQVSGPMSASAITDGNGFYSISGLTAGTYTVCVMAPMGWTQTAPSAGNGPTCSNATVGISIEAPALVGDVLYSDVDFGFVSN